MNCLQIVARFCPRFLLHSLFSRIEEDKTFPIRLSSSMLDICVCKQKRDVNCSHLNYVSHNNAIEDFSMEHKMKYYVCLPFSGLWIQHKRVSALDWDMNPRDFLTSNANFFLFLLRQSHDRWKLRLPSSTPSMNYSSTWQKENEQ